MLLCYYRTVEQCHSNRQTECFCIEVYSSCYSFLLGYWICFAYVLMDDAFAQLCMT